MRKAAIVSAVASIPLLFTVNIASAQQLGTAAEARAMLDKAAAASGLPRETLMRALPWIAALMMGALGRAADKPMRRILARHRGDRFAEHVAEPFAPLLKELNEPQKPSGGLTRTLDGLVGRLTGSGHAARA